MGFVSEYAFIGFKEAVVIDVETTGLNSEVDRIISVALLKLDFSIAKIGADVNFPAFTGIYNPQIPIPNSTTKIHGFKDEDVKDEEVFAESADVLREFIGDLPIIGHNVQFDKKFLSAEFKRAGLKTLRRNRSYCTMKRIRDHYAMCGEKVRYPKLEDAAALFEIKGRRADLHDATEDALIALKMAVALYKIDNEWPVKKPKNKRCYHHEEKQGPDKHYEEVANSEHNQIERTTDSALYWAIGCAVVLLSLGITFF